MTRWGASWIASTRGSDKQVPSYWIPGLCSNVVRESSRILKAVEKAGRHGGESDKSRGVRHRHIHDPGIQQEPFYDAFTQLYRHLLHITQIHDELFGNLLI